MTSKNEVTEWYLTQKKKKKAEESTEDSDTPFYWGLLYNGQQKEAERLAEKSAKGELRPEQQNAIFEQKMRTMLKLEQEIDKEWEEDGNFKAKGDVRQPETEEDFAEIAEAKEEFENECELYGLDPETTSPSELSKIRNEVRSVRQ